MKTSTLHRNTFLLLTCAIGHFFATSAQAQTNGTLDPNFNTTGYTISDISGNATADQAVGVALMSNGRYFVAGTAGASGNIGLARYAADGGLQQSALRLNTPSPGSINARACIKNPAGNTFYVAASQSTTGTNKQWVIARFNEDLTFDTYGQSIPSGHNKLNWGDPDTEVGGIDATSDGKVVIAGHVGGNIALARFTSAGVLDDTFSSDGMVITDVPGGTDEKLHAVGIAPDGGIIVAGEISTSLGSYGLIGRYTPSGDIDFSFGTEGFKTINFTGSLLPGDWGLGGSTRLFGMTIRSDGKIVVVGRCTNTDGDETDFIIARLNADGSLDDTFTSDGMVKVGFAADPPFNTDVAHSVALDPSSAMIVAGTVSTSGGGIGLVRVLSDGTIDPDFGTGGTVVTDLGNNHTLGAVIVAGERIVIAGSIRSGLGSSTRDTFIARYFHITVGVLEFALVENTVNIYPNPINEAVTFQYTLLESERLTIALHDLQGRVITTFLDGQVLPAGEHRQTVAMPADLASGNYLVVFSSPKGRMSMQVSK